MKHSYTALSRTLFFLLAVLFLVSCSSCRKSPDYHPEDGRIAATVGGEDISADIFTYFWHNTRNDYPEKSRDFLKNEVGEILKKNQAIRSLAAEYGVKLDKDDKEKIVEQMDALKKEKGDGYLSYLADHGMTPYAFYEIQSFTRLWKKLYDYAMSEENGVIAVSDAVLEEDLPKNFRRIAYVMIKKNGGYDAPEKTAAEVYALASAGEDFAGLIERYGEDSTMQAKVSTGYYYTIGQIDDTVAAAVEKMSEGDISSPIESDIGFYIIKRLPLEEAYVNARFEELRTMCKARKFNEMIAEKSSKIAVNYTDLSDVLIGE